MKIAVLLSGGVDSSVALKLLLDQGHDIHAFYLKIWLEDELAFLGECPWEDDLEYARAVCEKYDVPLEVVPFQKEYFDRVVSYTIDEVKKGRTPNPDILCNREIKFGAFYEKFADQFDAIATGHYARTETRDGLVWLKKAKDSFKDQTYFLAHLRQAQVAKAMFPLGDYTKTEIRAMAEEFDLPNKARKDSQGICFLGKISFRDFVKAHVGTKTGDIIEFETGKKLGEHEGFWFYTIGQRKGIGLGGGPWFVVKKDIPQNVVYVSREYYADDKVRDECEIADCNWIAQPPSSQNVQVKFRHGEKIYDAVLTPQDTGYHVKIGGRDQGIAPGQFVVVYENETCLGGGIIV